MVETGDGGYALAGSTISFGAGYEDLWLVKTAGPIPSDMNGDGIVDILDVVFAAIAFGSYPGHPNWNPIADLKPDGLINIFDLVIIGVNFGRTE